MHDEMRMNSGDQTCKEIPVGDAELGPRQLRNERTAEMFQPDNVEA